MASLKLTVALSAQVIQTDEKGWFHHDLEECRYPSRVTQMEILRLCCGYTKIRRRVHVCVTGELYKA